MLERRIIKTLETVLARYTRCEMFLARFYDARSREFQSFIMKNWDAFSVCRECLTMHGLRIIKTLETVLARFTRCELFLARFYDARLQEFQYSLMKKRVVISVRLVYCGFYNNDVMPVPERVRDDSWACCKKEVS